MGNVTKEEEKFYNSMKKLTKEVLHPLVNLL